jgi:hypothetical protein
MTESRTFQAGGLFIVGDGETLDEVKGTETWIQRLTLWRCVDDASLCELWLYRCPAGRDVRLVDDKGAEYPETRIEWYECVDCENRLRKTLTA